MVKPSEWYIHQSSVLDLAVLRFWMIAMGILAALAMNGLIFPRHCRVCSYRHFCDLSIPL